MPVFEGNIDNIVGVLVREGLAAPHPGRNSRVELARIMRPAYFVPETKKINRLLRQFQRKHLVMAVVSDEFGGVSGIVTIEDIMEELVGEIQDEYDNEVPVVEKVSESEYRVNTSTSIPDANEFLPYPLPEGDDYETVGGLLNVLYGKHSGGGRRGRAGALRVSGAEPHAPRGRSGAAASTLARDHRRRRN